ncbi:AMP-binding protein, partial [Mesorhizobium sp. M7A.F.Ca.CA.003.01.2.1]
MPVNLDELKNASNLRGRGARAGGVFVAPVDGRAHVSGERSVPLLDKTIPALFSETVSKYGTLDAAVFVDQNKRFTWSELSDTVDALAAGFLALGLAKGDRVGIWSPNRWEWLVTQFATARIGLILVNINPAYRLTELDYALNKVGCKALVTAARFKTSDYLGMIETLAPEIAKATPGKLKAQKLPALKIVIRMGDENSPGMFNFGDVLAMAGRDEHDSLDRISEKLKPGEAINIQFTSGTTGAPKGATLTHGNIVNNGNFVTSAIKLTA